MLPVLKKAFWLFGISIFLLILFLPGYTKLQELRDKIAELESKNKQLRVENTLFEEELKRIQSDPVYQEKITREKMGVVRRGEVPVKLVPEAVKE